MASWLVGRDRDFVSVLPTPPPPGHRRQTPAPVSFFFQHPLPFPSFGLPPGGDWGRASPPLARLVWRPPLFCTSTANSSSRDEATRSPSQQRSHLLSPFTPNFLSGSSGLLCLAPPPPPKVLSLRSAGQPFGDNRQHHLCVFVSVPTAPGERRGGRASHWNSRWAEGLTADSRHRRQPCECTTDRQPSGRSQVECFRLGADEAKSWLARFARPPYCSEDDTSLYLLVHIHLEVSLGTTTRTEFLES